MVQRSIFKSKLGLNSKKVELKWWKKFSPALICFLFALKLRLQALKFEFCQVKLG